MITEEEGSDDDDHDDNDDDFRIFFRLKQETTANGNDIFPKRQISDSSKLKAFADENLNLDENGRKFSRRVKNTVGKE